MRMFLKKLSVLNFKNIAQADVAFDARINCFVGSNGAGKTNLLDAVYYLSMCKSSTVMSDGQCVRHGGDFFLIDGEYSDGGDRKHTVVCSFKKQSGKNIKANGKEYDRISDHIGKIPAVIVSPADSMLVTDSAEERRRFLNAFLSQLDRQYLLALIRYNHVLSERNRFLKSDASGYGGGDLLEVLDQQLVQWGSAVHAKRSELVAELSPLVAE